MNGGQRAPHVFVAIDRVIDLLNMRGKLAVQLTHAGGGGRGYDNGQVRQFGLQRLDELRADIYLTDTHGMDPKHMAVRYRLFDLGVVTAKTLAKSVHPMPAPPHLQKIVGRAQPEEDREQKVVNPLHRFSELGRHYPLRIAEWPAFCAIPVYASPKQGL